jgi:hypothetical protein
MRRRDSLTPRTSTSRDFGGRRPILSSPALRRVWQPRCAVKRRDVRAGESSPPARVVPAGRVFDKTAARGSVSCLSAHRRREGGGAYCGRFRKTCSKACMESISCMPWVPSASIPQIGPPTVDPESGPGYVWKSSPRPVPPACPRCRADGRMRQPPSRAGFFRRILYHLRPGGKDLRPAQAGRHKGEPGWHTRIARG